jgi:PAS domain S-box-containing protein
MTVKARTDSVARRRFVLAAALTAATLAAIAVVLVSGVPLGTKRVLSNVAFPVTSGAACASWLVALRRSAAPSRAAVLLAAMTAAWTVGNVFWCYYQLIADAQPFPGYNDIFYIAALVFGATALVVFPGVRALGRERLRAALDAVVVAGSVFFVSGALALGPIFDAASGSPLARAVFLTYPIGDLVLITLGLLLLARAPRGQRLQLGLLTLGVIAYAIADTQYTGNVAAETFAVGTPLDLGWIGGYLLVGLAAWAPATPADQVGPARSDGLVDRHADTGAADTRAATVSSIVRSLVVYLPLFVALVVSADQPITFDQPLLAIDGVIVIAALGARQVLLAADNESLRRDLEGKVLARTAEVATLARRSEAVISAVGDGIYGVDRDGAVTFANPAAEAVLGYPAEELVGLPAHAVLHATRPDGSTYPWAECPLAVALRTGETVISDREEYRAKDGRFLPIELTASPLIEDGRIQGAVVAFRDITKRREVDRMKDEFVSVVSHELRTPLTSIRGSLGLVSSGALGELSPKAARMIAVAAESTDRLTRLINDILDIERIESGSMPMERTVTDVRGLVATAVQELQPVAAAAEVHLVTHAEEAYVEADSDRITQTVTNLVSNAVKFSKPGDVVVVRASVEARDVVVSVADQGRGIPHDKIEVIFERFQQVDSSDARQKGGTGLGLAICKGIIEKHGGRIWAESTIGVGSVFRFTLPVVRRARASEGVADAPAVLVCDDDLELLGVVSAQLSNAGFRTIACTEASDAFRIAVEERPAAVVLDLNMPAPDGRDAFRNLLLHPATRDVPVVVLSVVLPDDEPYIAERATGWVNKPVDAATLVRVVSAAVRRRARPVVLVVEDDQPLADVFAASLEAHGLVTSAAATADEAVNLGKRLLPDVLISTSPCSKATATRSCGGCAPTRGSPTCRWSSTRASTSTARRSATSALAGRSSSRSRKLVPGRWKSRCSAWSSSTNPTSSTRLRRWTTVPSRRVLVVDDEDLIREVAQLTLEVTAGWEVLTAATGDEGFRTAAREQPDAVLLDVMMPGTDGPTTVSWLQGDAATRGIPIVMLTAKVQQLERDRVGSLAGVAGVIAKPFDPMQLAADVCRLLGWDE